MAYLFELRGAPKFVRSDNGPEVIVDAVRRWLKESGSDTLYIEPGSQGERGKRLLRSCGEKLERTFRSLPRDRQDAARTPCAAGTTLPSCRSSMRAGSIWG